MPFDPISYAKAKRALARAAEVAEPKPVLYAGDETEVSEDEIVAAVTKKSLLVVRDSVNLPPTPEKMVVVVEGKIDTAGQTLTIKIVVDGSPVGNIEFTETTYTLKALVTNISGWADGIHSVDMQMQVTGGVGYNKLFEVWLR